MTTQYPLSAVAHQSELVLALSLLAIAPEIGGLLIRGDRGSAKSTAARGLAHLLPTESDVEAPFVNLPLGATEDRVVGTLDIDAALQGEAKLKPGLMAQANGGLLYIDEVNLLPDHLVDVLLDAAAMGIVRVQRDSLSVEATAHFALIGSMNPEEGGLRPQFLDRFGLCVDVIAPLEAEQRAEIIRRRMAFEADAGQFIKHWATEEKRFKQRFQAARKRFAKTTVPDMFLIRIAKLTAAAGVRSLRADLVLHRTARAHAALDGRIKVTWEDIKTVAPLVLNHRHDPNQASPPPPSEQPQPPQNPAPPNPDPSEQPDQHLPEHEQPDDQNDSQNQSSTQPQEASEDVYAPSKAQAPSLPSQERSASGSGHGGGRLDKIIRTVSDPTTDKAHIPDTMRAALIRGKDEPFQLSRDDLRKPVHEEQSGRWVLFVVDTSGSMGVSGRMSAVKGAMLSVLSDQARRDRVALITFRGSGADLALRWTTQAAEAEAAIRNAPTGGRTPLAHALQLANELLSQEKRGELVLFTDGRANVPLTPGGEGWNDALTTAAQLKPYPSVVVNTETGHVRLNRAIQLAKVMASKMQELSPKKEA